MIDDRIEKRLRNLQSKFIQEEQTSFSYSKVVNGILAKHFKIQNFKY